MRLSLLAIALASLGAAAPSRPADLTPVKADLRKLVAAQEKYYSDNGSYASNFGPLQLTPGEGVSLKLLEHTPNAYSAEGTLKGADGVSCVMMVGRITPPKTAKGKAATEEGAVMCDE